MSDDSTDIPGKGETVESSVESATTSDHNRPSRRRLSKNLSKWLLICWAIVVLHIWFASDGSDEFLESPYAPHRVREGAELDFRPERLGRPMEETSFVFPNNVPDVPDVPDVMSSALPDGSHTRPLPAVQSARPANSSCCFIAAVRDSSKQLNDVSCRGTCFTERACRDPSYPFDSAEQKEYFAKVNRASLDMQRLRRECHSPKLMQPPVQWCHNATNNTTNTSLSQLLRHIPPPHCGLISQAGGSGPFHNLLFFPSAKFAFCGVPKAGITQWKQFARFVAGANDYLSLPHFKLDVQFFSFGDLPEHLQKEIWEDDEWTMAAFLRDPAERLLSAYLDKISNKIAKGDNHTMKRLNIHQNFTFQDFIHRLSSPFPHPSCKTKNNPSGLPMTGLNWCSDPHWRPQIYSCGMSEQLHRFQYLGAMEHAAEGTKALLHQVGLWESHGSHYIHEGYKSRSMCSIKAQSYNSSDDATTTTTTATTNVGFQQKDPSRNLTTFDTVYGHSKSAITKMDEYYTPELLDKVRKLYQHDYKLWKFLNDKQGLISGKEAASYLSPKCTFS